MSRVAHQSSQSRYSKLLSEFLSRFLSQILASRSPEFRPSRRLTQVSNPVSKVTNFFDGFSETLSDFETSNGVGNEPKVVEEVSLIESGFKKEQSTVSNLVGVLTLVGERDE